MTSRPPDLEDTDNPPEGPPTIFVSDPSAEADRLSTSLRARGYTVIDVPLSLLLARVAVQRPSVILLDVDADAALDVMARLREIPGGQSVDVLLLGNPQGESSDLAHAEVSGFLARPVDVPAVLDRVDALVRARREGAPLSAPDSSIPATPHANRTYSARPGPPPTPRLSVAPPRSATGGPPSSPRRAPESRRGVAPAIDVVEADLATSLEAGEKTNRFPLPSLSPEIEHLLHAAEERSRAEPGPGSSSAGAAPSPEEEVDAVLPTELLAALDEPLDESDELDGDSSLITGFARKPTSTPAASAPPVHPQVHLTPSNTPHASPVPPRMPVDEPPASVDANAVATPRPPRPAEPPPAMAQSPSVPPPDPPFGSMAPPRAPAERETVPPPFWRDGRGRSSISSVPPRPPPSSRPEPAAARGSSFSGGRRPSRPGDTARPGPWNERERTRDKQDPSRRARTPSEPSPAPRAHDDSSTSAPPLELPDVLGPGAAVHALALCVRARSTGALSIEVPEGVRRILLRDGDVVTAASGLDSESLVAFLEARGDLAHDVALQLRGKVPAYGRHAGAALVANGQISQDQLWPVLRAHAEWILARAIATDRGTAGFELSPPARLRTEPSVFGGATGAEVLIEAVRRTVPAGAAIERLGGDASRLIDGPRPDLLAECALSGAEQEALERSRGRVLSIMADGADDFAPILYALVELAVLDIAKETKPAEPPRLSSPAFDPWDEGALRAQVKARLSLVQEADYFTLLGVPRTATAYEIHRAYLDLRRALEPTRVLSAGTADLADDLLLITDVLEEAHEILRDQVRRERYRKAIEAKPPSFGSEG